MKIAWCHTGVTGGAKRATYDMVRELARRGYVIDEYIVCDRPVLDYLPLRDFVRNTYLFEFGQPVRPTLHPYALETYTWLGMCAWHRKKITPKLKQLAHDMNHRPYDFVHLDHHPGAHTAGLLPYLKHPTVVYSHEVSGVRYKGINSVSNGNGSFAKRIYDHLCDFAIIKERQIMENYSIHRMNHASRIFCNSCHSKDLFFHIYGRIPTTIYYGVDNEKFRPLSLPVKPMVLSVGRLVKAKQHHVVIESVARMPKNRRPQVVIAAPETDTLSQLPMHLKQLAKEKDVDLVIQRHPEEDELVKLYNQAIAVVYVPIMEPFGLVSLEAMACGTPVIGIREGGIRESIVDGQTGILVDRNPDQIASAITRLMESDHLRAEMSRNAIEYIRNHWTWQRAMDRYESEVLRFLMKKNSHDNN